MHVRESSWRATGPATERSVCGGDRGALRCGALSGQVRPRPPACALHELRLSGDDPACLPLEGAGLGEAGACARDHVGTCPELLPELLPGARAVTGVRVQ